MNGWAESYDATSAQYAEANNVGDGWIKAHPNGIHLYAVWTQYSQSSLCGTSTTTVWRTWATTTAYCSAAGTSFTYDGYTWYYTGTHSTNCLSPYLLGSVPTSSIQGCCDIYRYSTVTNTCTHTPYSSVY